MTDRILSKNEFSYKFSCRLDKLMRSKGIKNRELAERIGMTKTAIYSYRTGASLPSVYISYKIAKALPCTIEALIDF